MTKNYHPDVTYDLYCFDEDCQRDPFPRYEVANRSFYDVVDRLPDGTHRRSIGMVKLSRSGTNLVLAVEHSEPLGVIENGLFIRADGQRFALVEVG
ncbi:hypothetical protein [Pseudomonas bohemica]|uniref:hypothetical protein n=1 Tax=Pseudomonas bohemica TaxID=2044872 RepID=UPI0018FED51E|nr:hypothetical protein [Pseudomonas bohemica]